MAIAPALAVSKIAGEKTKTRGMLYEKCNLFYLSGLLFFLVAVLNLVTGENHSTAVVWLCLGSSYSCLGYSHQKK